MEGLAVEGGPDDVRRRLVHPRPRLATAHRVAEDEDADGHEDGDGKGGQDRTTGRGGPAYLSVAVPVIAGTGWIEQMYL